MSALLLPAVTQDATGNFLIQGRYIPRILGASAVAVSGAADTNENTLGTISVPANAMGANGILRISVEFSYTNSVNNKTLRARFSGAAGTQYMSVVSTTTTGGRSTFYIANAGATNSQKGSSILFLDNTGILVTTKTTSAVDTTAATTVVITGQKASAGETLTLESYLGELLLP